MTSTNDNADEFWGAQRDWTDSHPRQRITGRTALSRRLKTGVQSVFDAGASASRAHGETGAAPVVGAVSHVAGDLDFDLTPEPNPVPRTGDGLSIGELAQPYEANVHAATQPVPRVSVGVVTPPANHFLDLDEPEVVADPAPSVTDDYSGLTVDTAPWDDDWDPAAPAAPVDTRRGAVDPLVAKLGVLAVVLTLVAGIFVSTRGGGADDSISTAESATTLAADASSNPKTQASGGNKKANRGNKSDAGGAVSADASTDQSAQDAEQAAPAETRAAEVECGAEYEVVQGDYWLRLADGSGVSLSNLLSANGAGTDTPLYPGSMICLPEGAATPPPPAPSTAAPAPETESASESTSSSKNSSSSKGSTDSGSASTKAPKAPAATAPATTAPPTTKAPATTTPPTTAAPASASEVERIIREIFPARQHEKALAVAWRESNHRPEVDNGWCCYGLFQIYYTVHQDWLRGFGVNQASDLYDARTNTIVAYELYRQAGGWGPWGG